MAGSFILQKWMHGLMKFSEGHKMDEKKEVLLFQKKYHQLDQGKMQNLSQHTKSRYFLILVQTKQTF